MSATDEQIRELITQRAADWFVANREGLTAEQRRSFTDWLKTSPMHVQEYLAASVIGRDLRQACTVSARSFEALIERARREEDSTVKALRATYRSTPDVGFWRGWRVAALAVSVVAVVTSCLVLFRNFATHPGLVTPEAVAALHFKTEHGQQQTHVLADNSVVHLNTDSDVTIWYDKTERAVNLAAGEAVFEVQHESGRPFRVTAKSAQIIDLGTQFDVRLKDATTVVTVVEGRVEVRPSSTTAAKRDGLEVDAGQQVSVTDGGLPLAPVSANTGRATAWLHRQISFDREPLQSVAEEFNRYAMKSIEITTPALRILRISGIFTTDDTAAFIAFLRSLDGVRVEETDSRIVVYEQNQHSGVR